MAIGNLFGGFISDIASGLYSELPEEVTEAFGDVPQATAPDVTFQPFTVTSGGIGSVTGGPSGTTYTLSGQQQALQDALMREAQYRIGGEPIGTLQSQFAGADLIDLGRGMIGTSPYGLSQQQQAAQQAFGLGGQFMGAAAQQPADINLMRGQFAGQVGGMLGQQPRPAIGQFGQQALSMGAAGLGAQAPADVEALRGQYGTLASQAAMDVLSPTAAREASVFERIRATQRPEEERQRLALEERLAQQGRLGVRTAMYGGTPEQLALSQAQEEAQNRASLAAIQQAQAERQQALGTAQTLGGMFGQQATLGGALQAQQAGLGQQYANLGSSLAAQRQALDTARQQQMLQMLTGGQGLISGGQALQSAEQQMGIQALQAGYAPQAALLSALSPALNIASMSDVARRQQGEFGLETQMANINAELARRAGLASLYGGMFSGAMGLGSSLLGGVTDIITDLIP